MAYVQMKVATPTEEDLDSTYQFMRILEALTDNRMYHHSDPSDWKEWDEDDEDFKVIKEAESYVCDYEEEEPDEVDQRIVLFQYIKNYFIKNPSALARIITCAQMAMDNAFDKDCSYIDWKPEIKALLEKEEEKNA